MRAPCSRITFSRAAFFKGPWIPRPPLPPGPRPLRSPPWPLPPPLLPMGPWCSPLPPAPVRVQAPPPPASRRPLLPGLEIVERVCALCPDWVCVLGSRTRVPPLPPRRLLLPATKPAPPRVLVRVPGLVPTPS
eukprot:26289-Heterocapsa_arctica.AAC.1